MKKRGLLLSGGLDSLAIAVWQRPDCCITIDYGQKPAAAEVTASRNLCAALEIDHVVVIANCSSVGSGDMAGTRALEIAPVPEWWPYRNQLLITLAASRAISLDLTEIMFGSVKTDSQHKDGAEEFFALMDALLRYQEGQLRLRAPAIHLDTAELIQMAKVEKPLLAFAHSCHSGNLACGRCRGCVKHRHVMAELGYDIY